MTPQSFRDNPATWHLSVNLRSVLALLQHLANDGHVTIARLAADFAERTLPYAGGNEGLIAHCVTSIRTWARDPTDAATQECKRAIQATRLVVQATRPIAAGAPTQATQAAAYSAYYAAVATGVTDTPSSTVGSPAHTYSAAYHASVCAYTRTLSDAAYREEQQWQLAHIRRKHPLTEL